MGGSGGGKEEKSFLEVPLLDRDEDGESGGVMSDGGGDSGGGGGGLIRLSCFLPSARNFEERIQGCWSATKMADSFNTIVVVETQERRRSGGMKISGSHMGGGNGPLRRGWPRSTRT